MGIRIYGRLSNGLWWSQPLGEMIKQTLTGFIALVVICLVINNWETVKELGFIIYQLTLLGLTIWVLRVIKRWAGPTRLN